MFNLPYQKETNDLKMIISNKLGILKEDEATEASLGIHKYVIENVSKAESYYVSITLNDEGFVCGLYMIHRMHNPLDKSDRGSVQKITLCDTYIDKDILQKAFDIVRL